MTHSMRQIINTVNEGLVVLVEVADSVSRYTSLGIEPSMAQRYLDARIPPKRAVQYEAGRQRYPETTFDEILSHDRTIQRHRREDAAYKKLVASLSELAAATTPLNQDQACAIVANDDRMFDSILMHVSGDPDWFEKSPEDSRRIFSVIKRMRPVRHPLLYRGECSYSERDNHSRGFHSWSIARDTAEYFFKDCGRDRGRLLLLTVAVQGLDLLLVGTWRMRLRPNESHYLGSQGEWLVPDGYPAKVIARW